MPVVESLALSFLVW